MESNYGSSRKIPNVSYSNVLIAGGCAVAEVHPVQSIACRGVSMQIHNCKFVHVSPSRKSPSALSTQCSSSSSPSPSSSSPSSPSSSSSRRARRRHRRRRHSAHTSVVIGTAAVSRFISSSLPPWSSSSSAVVHAAIAIVTISIAIWFVLKSPFIRPRIIGLPRHTRLPRLTRLGRGSPGDRLDRL